MLAEEPDVRKALVRFREGLGGNLRGAPSLLDLRCGSLQSALRESEDAKEFGEHPSIDREVSGLWHHPRERTTPQKMHQ